MTADRAAANQHQGMSISSAVGRAIRELRDQRRMTARDLSSQSGVSAAMISRIESGQVSPSLQTLEALAGSFAVPVVSLFRSEERRVGKEC